MSAMEIEKMVLLFEHNCCDYFEYGDKRNEYVCMICGERRNIGASVTRCCGEVTFDDRNGNFGCEKCGMITHARVTDGQAIYENEYVKDANPQKRRHYRSRIHFCTHLRRYMGDTSGDIPERCYKLVREKIDVKDRNAYEDARKLFKEHKLGAYYRHIFRILYDLGGIRPELSNECIQKVKADFNALEIYFYDHSDGECYFNNHGALIKRRKSLGKFCRKSMPSLAMLLVILLEKNGHEIYYRMAYLKDVKLKEKVLEFYDEFQRDIIEPWGNDEQDV